MSTPTLIITLLVFVIATVGFIRSFRNHLQRRAEQKREKEKNKRIQKKSRKGRK